MMDITENYSQSPAGSQRRYKVYHLVDTNLHIIEAKHRAVDSILYLEKLLETTKSVKEWT